MSDFKALLLRLFAVAALGLMAPAYPVAVHWVAIVLLLAGFKTRYAAALLALAWLWMLATLPRDFQSSSALLAFAGTGLAAMFPLLIAGIGAGAFSVDEWLRSRRIRRAEAACTAAPSLSGGHARLDAAISRCVDLRLRAGSRLRAWLDSPSNRERHAR